MNSTSHITFLPFSSLPITKWKNGLGETRQVAIYPSDAELTLLNFHYRISMATIKIGSEFSSFPSFMRYLTPLEGGALLLNHERLPIGEITRFQGDKKIYAEPLLTGGEDTPVIDLGIIYNPLTCSVTFQKLSKNGQYPYQNPADTITYFVIQNGSATFECQILKPKDTFFMSDENKVTINFSHCQYFEIQIRKPNDQT